MGWGAVVAGGLSLVSGMMSSSAVSSAADAQSAASMTATEAQVAAAKESAAAMIEAAGIGAEATKEAAAISAKAVTDSTRMAIEEQRRALEEARKYNEPYVEAGKRALATFEQKLAAGPGDFEASPGYQFRLDQGNKSVLAARSATGNIASGRALQELQYVGQNIASEEYANFYNRYLTELSNYGFLTSIGQNAAALTGNQAMAAGGNISTSLQNQGANLASIYTNSGNQQVAIAQNLGNSLAQSATSQGNAIAQNAMNQGNIAANASIGTANAWTSAINQGLNFYAMSQMFSGAGTDGSGSKSFSWGF